MSWSKMLVSALLIMVSFSGCAEMISGTLFNIVSPQFKKKEPFYLETVDNEEFKTALLANKLKLQLYPFNKNVVCGPLASQSLKESDILLVDNSGDTFYADWNGVTSEKIVVTKEGFAILDFTYDTWRDRDKPFDWHTIWYICHDVPYIYPMDDGREMPLTATMGKDKVLYFKRPGVHFYQHGYVSDLMRIKSRYNDIDKRKSIIDERVEYFKKLQADSAQK